MTESSPSHEHASRVKCPQCGSEKVQVQRERRGRRFSTADIVPDTSARGLQWRNLPPHDDAGKPIDIFRCLYCHFSWSCPEWWDGTLHPVMPVVMRAEERLATWWPMGKRVVTPWGPGEVRDCGPTLVFVRLTGRSDTVAFFPSELTRDQEASVQSRTVGGEDLGGGMSVCVRTPIVAKVGDRVKILDSHRLPTAIGRIGIVKAIMSEDLIVEFPGWLTSKGTNMTWNFPWRFLEPVPTPKFRVGDRVRIKPEGKGSSGWISAMDSTIGRIGVIAAEVSPFFLVEFTEVEKWSYLPEALEYNLGDLLPIKRGDFVRINTPGVDEILYVLDVFPQSGILRCRCVSSNHSKHVGTIQSYVTSSVSRCDPPSQSTWEDQQGDPRIVDGSLVLLCNHRWDPLIPPRPRVRCVKRWCADTKHAYFGDSTIEYWPTRDCIFLDGPKEAEPR